MNENRLWIMVDLEASGPVIGRHSMTELGAVVGSKAKGVISSFEAIIQPISDEVKTSRDSTPTGSRMRAGSKPSAVTRTATVRPSAAADGASEAAGRSSGSGAAASPVV